jgi:hypothetical protein
MEKTDISKFEIMTYNYIIRIYLFMKVSLQGLKTNR